MARATSVKRKDGRFEARVWVFTTEGKEIRKSVYGATWDEVHAAMVRLKADAITGVRVPATGATIAEYLTYWLDEIAQHRVRPSTLASYRWLTRTYVAPYLGTKKLARLRPSDVRQFLNRLKGVCQCCALGKDAKRVERGMPARCCAKKPRQCCEAFLSDGSVRYAHRLLRAALQDAVLEELLATNPAMGLRNLAPVPTEVHPLDGGRGKAVPQGRPRGSLVCAVRGGAVTWATPW